MVFIGHNQVVKLDPKMNKNDAILLKRSQKEKFAFDCLVEFFE